ncbi:LppU/SCO3897 family protein [Nocardia brasiliensis]|uniref:LppU/SCO3897 family protein n=1 Tax=Nocardia brasiliensis TaxID=37326 RepID=UPI002455FF6C|nr:hypothetical protein [Nocardia brasiliensis]
MTTPPNYPYPGQPGGQGYAQPSYPQAQGYPGQPAQPGYGPGYPPPGTGYPPQPGMPQQGMPQQGFPPPQGVPPQGFPPHGGQPGFPPGAFPPPGPPPRSGGKAKAIIITVVILGVIAVVALVVSVGRPDGKKVAVGECAKLSGTTYKAEFAIKECSDPEANYVVAQRIDGSNKNCENQDYASYYETGRNGYTLCLRLNVKEGDCIKSGTLAASTKVACSSAADYKIGRIVRGSADKSACGPKYTEDSTIVYPKPDPMTLCLVEPK